MPLRYWKVAEDKMVNGEIGDPLFWMFANGIITGLNLICVGVLIIHLIVRRREFSWQKHGFSVAVIFYLFGELIFHVLYWHLWSVLKSADPVVVAEAMLKLFSNPVVKFATLFNLIGMVMIIWVLTTQVRFFWIFGVIVTVVVSALLAWWHR